MELHVAPMQGYADYLWLKNFCDVYGAPDVCYTPFIRVEKGRARHQDMARLVKSVEMGLPIVPQIIFGSVDEFALLVDSLRGLGIDRIDLNLGCPYPMMTRRGRGAAMVGNVAVMEKVARRIEADTDMRYSVKMRPGMECPDEWERLMPLLNALPLAHVAMHARTARQMYDGQADTDVFARFYDACGHPVAYNGDIVAWGDIGRVAARFPGVAGVMVGRGLLGCPSLFAEWRRGGEWDDVVRMECLRRFHDALLGDYRAGLCGDTQVLQHLKPFWQYLEPVIGRRASKAIRKAATLRRYDEAIRGIFGV